MNYNLINFFGLQRSGNHGVINWILGLDEGILFYNNVHPNKDLKDSFWPVSIPENSYAYKTRVNGKIIDHSHFVDDAIKEKNPYIIMLV